MFCKAASFWVLTLEWKRGNPFFRKRNQMKSIVQNVYFSFDAWVNQCSSLCSFSPLLFLTSARCNNFNPQYIGVAQVLFRIMLTFSVFSILIICWSFPCWKPGEGFEQQQAGHRQSKQQSRAQQSCCSNLQTAGHVQIFANCLLSTRQREQQLGDGLLGKDRGDDEDWGFDL